MRCETLIEDFLSSGWYAHQWSSGTLRVYRSELFSFYYWIHHRQGKILLTAANEDVIAFLAAKSTGKICTHNLRISVLRSFYRHLMAHHGLEHNPCLGIRSIVRERDLPNVLTVTQVAQLLECVNLHTPNGVRNRAILELLYATGMRVNELVLLDLANLRLEDRYLIVRAQTSKSSSDRIIPFGAIAAHWLTRYLNEVRPSLSRMHSAHQTEHYLVFLGQCPSGGISTKTCHNLVANHAQRAGISQRVSPHTLRHSFATHLLDHGANLLVVQKLLGHVSVQTTQIYTHIAIARLHQVHERHHPRGALFDNPVLAKGRHYPLHHSEESG